MTKKKLVTYTLSDGTKRERKSPTTKRERRDLTEEIARHLPWKRKQYMVWDKDTKGLHVMVSPGGARTYRSLWDHPGSSKIKPHTRKLGRVGEDDVGGSTGSVPSRSKGGKGGQRP